MLLEHAIAFIDLLFFTGLWPALWTTAFIIGSLLFVSYDYYKAEYTLFVIYLAIMNWGTALQPLNWIWNNPYETAEILGVYFGIGAVYSIVKYWSFVTDIIREVRDLKVVFLRNRTDGSTKVSDPIPKDLETAWRDHLRLQLAGIAYSEFKSGISPAKQKARLANWIAFWPFSAIGLFLADPLKYVVVSIRNGLHIVYQITFKRIVNRYIHVSDISFSESTDY